MLDVTNPDGPAEISSFDTPGDARRVVVLGAGIYVADGVDGLSSFALVTPRSYIPISRQ
jgi:hypothetical protein